MTEKCFACGRELTGTEIALTRKLINRGTDRFLCLDCLSEKFRLSREELTDLADRYRRAGCTLFQ